MNKLFLTCALSLISVFAFDLTAQSSKTPQYTITVEEVEGKSITGLHSFAYGKNGDYLLIIGGRTNGYHGTSGIDPNSTFPIKNANQKIVVINYKTGQEWSADIPKDHFEQFTSTNPQYYQDGNTLFIAGGYGVNSKGDYMTFPTLTALNVKKVISAVRSGKTKSLDQNINSINDDMFQVTGGELLKIEDKYYLVFGQNYSGKYSPGNTGAYTNEIREIEINSKGKKLSAKLVKTFKDGNRPNETTRFHRRDLNVVPQIMADKSEGLAVYGGVFTLQDGAWLNPVILSQKPGTTALATTILEDFTQQMSQYACASVLVYDPSSQAMLTTLLGGISGFAYNASGELKPDADKPWINTITTYVRHGDNSYEERIQGSGAEVSLPALIGGESKFIPSSGLLYSGSHEIMDYSKIQKTKGGLIGYMIGGILSPTAQTRFQQSTANTKIYKVYLKID